MEILEVQIDDIRAYENNAKEHPREQIEQIKRSILEYGNNDPIAVDENNVIIEGHGRFIALKELGRETVEIIRLEHMTEEQKNAYRLVHNKLTMNSDFDFSMLEKELAELTAFDVDMSLYGFDESIFDEVNAPPKEKERKDLSEDVSECFEVIVECSDEVEQERIYNKLTGEGLICRVLTL